MACEYCLQIGGNHDKRCPNYTAPESRYKCVVCNEYIQQEKNFWRMIMMRKHIGSVLILVMN